jgi:CHAD domain-containing protein
MGGLPSGRNITVVDDREPKAVRETERKYEVAGTVDDELVADVAAAVGFPQPAAPAEFALSAVYYDTADLRLARSRLTLRRRRGGSDDGWHLKLPAGKDSRDEIRVPLGRFRMPPQELVALSRVAHRDAPLQPVVEVATVRREWTLTDDEGRAVATVTDDRVTGRTLENGVSGGSGMDTDTEEWAEIEVELAEHGTAVLLDRIEDALARAGVQRSASSSKLARVLADRIPEAPAPPRADPGASAGDVVLAYLHEQANALRATDPQVRRDASDGVHQMRVACRRMRSTLQSFRALLDRSRTDDLVVELRWLAGELGGARDLEVQEQRIGAAVAALPPEIALGPVAARTTRFFASRRGHAGATAAAALDGDRYVALLDAVDALLADPPLTERAGEPAVTVLPELLGKSLRRARRALRAAHAHAPGHERDEQLHEMRKAAKRLRYAGEASASALGTDAKKLVKRVKAVQELLGEHQDSVVARGLLRELGAGTSGSRANGFAFGWLLRDEQARAERVETDLDTAWKGLRRRARTVIG